MPWIDTTDLTQAVSEIKAYCVGLFFPKTGGNVSGDVSASGEVSATETVGVSTITHNLTEKLDEDDYLAGMTWDEIEARFTWDDLDGTSTSGDDTYTPNLNLTKPGRLSTAAVNRDMDLIDAAVGAVDVENDGSLAEQVGRKVGNGVAWQNIILTTDTVGGHNVLNVSDGDTYLGYVTLSQ